jgi:hypothetical protein
VVRDVLHLPTADSSGDLIFICSDGRIVAQQVPLPNLHKVVGRYFDKVAALVNGNINSLLLIRYQFLTVTAPLHLPVTAMLNVMKVLLVRHTVTTVGT